jgi:hypothetical protein
MHANNPNDHDITSQEIYDNSYQHTSYTKFVYLDACNLGNSISGMPYAWLHTTSISTDGYHNPDYSLKCFVGWSGSAPYITNTVDGQTYAGYWFVYQFYVAALSLGYNVNAALDYASQQLWQIDFDNSNNKFYTGWDEWVGLNHYVFGHMVVYGQGTLYIGNEAYVSNYVDMSAGYVMAQVADPYNLEGPNDDGHFTELLAAYWGDYAWVTGYMQREASGDVYLWGYSLSEATHLTVYVSDDYYYWGTLYDDYVYWSDPEAIYLGYTSNQFRYIAICVQNDQGYPAHLFVDAVHVQSRTPPPPPQTYYVSSIAQYSTWAYGQVHNPDSLIGNSNDGNYAQIYGGNLNDGGNIVGWMNDVAHGHVYLYGYSAPGYYTHMYVYVSYNNNNDWTEITRQTVYPSSAGWIDCCSYSGNFRYIAIAAIDDNGMSANLYIDSVRVTS